MESVRVSLWRAGGSCFNDWSLRYDSKCKLLITRERNVPARESLYARAFISAMRDRPIRSRYGI